MGFERQKDFGTPESRAAEAVTLTIDGRDVTVPAGTSVMRAAWTLGTSPCSAMATRHAFVTATCFSVGFSPRTSSQK